MSPASPTGNPKSPAGQRTAQASPVGAAPSPASKQPGSFPASSVPPSTSITRFESLPRTYVSCSNSTAAAGGQRAATVQPSTHQQQNQDAADAALYRDMRESLADFEARQQQLARQPASSSQRTSSSRPAHMPPRQTAFYSALRSVLQQVLAESTPAGRHTRLLAAHAWYVGHRPRAIPADPGLAAALAASLSISTPAGQQQQQQDCLHSLPAGAGAAGRGSSASACGRWPPSTVPATAAGCDGGAGCDDFFVGCEDDVGWPSSPQDAPCPDGSSSQHQQHASPQNTSSRVAAATTPAALAGPGAGTSGGGGALLLASKLEDAAQTAFSSSWQPPSGRGSNGGSSRSGADAAAEVPGLIPVGCLPSTRFACSSSAQGSDAAGTASAAGAAPRTSSCSGHHTDQQQQWQQQWQQRQQWSAVSAQQAVLEAQVASGMRGFARQRARIEEDISMRQELAAVAAATAAAAAAAAAGEAGACEAGAAHEGGRASEGVMGQPGVRFLQHVDSQHQPSQVTAEPTRVGAGVLAGKAAAGAGCSGPAGGGVQLLVMDRVKAARKQHLQEGVQECCLLQQKLGVSNEVLSRALLPVPDVPYMSAFGQLPTYSPAAKAGAAGRKKSGKKAKAKAKAKKKKGAEVKVKAK